MTAALRQSAALSAANAANNLVALVITLAAARILSTADFGALGLALAVTVVTATVADWGTSLALVRAIGREPAAARASAAAVLAWKALLLVLLAALGAAVPLGPVADLWPALADRALLLAALLAAGLLGAWTTRRAITQAAERFAELQRDALACAALRALAFGAVAAAGKVTPVTALLCLYGAPHALLLVGALRNARGLDPRALAAAARTVARYCGWVGVAALCFVAFTRAPVLALGADASPHELGLLSAALTLALGLALIGDALRTVALPRLLRTTDAAQRDRARRWVRRTAWPVLGLAAIALAALASAYGTLLGEAHAAGAPVLLVLGAALLLTAALGLENALLHALGQPRLEAVVNLGRLAAFLVLAHAVPPTALAVACAFAIVLVGGELALFVAVRWAERVERAERAELAERPAPLAAAPQP